MARTVRGRITHGSLPSWPPLRVRAVVNGVCLTAAGVLLLYLTWSVLNFRVFDASRTAMVLRVLAIWFAVGLPVGSLAIGLHMLVTAVTARDRLLLSHGAASWDPGEFDEVLRGVRVRNWRPEFGKQSGAFSAKTLGWMPVQTRAVLIPLAAGLVAAVVLMIWLATGYGTAALVLFVTIAWVGWRAWRAWTALQDYRMDRRRTATVRNTSWADDGPGSRRVVVTADEAWDEEDHTTYQPPARPDPDQREQQLRQAMAESDPPRRNDVRVEATQPLDVYPEDSTDLIPVYREPDDEPEYAAVDPPARGTAADTASKTAGLDERRSSHRDAAPARRGWRSRKGSADAETQVVLVDRSAQRARQARLRKSGEVPDDASRSRGRSTDRTAATTGPQAGRGRGRGLRSYFGDRVTQRPGREEAPSAESRTAASSRGRSGAPSRDEAEREIYERQDRASSLFGYMWRRPKDR